MDLKSVALLPGELKQLIELSVADLGGVPDFLRASLGEEPASTRTLLQIREESRVDHTSLARHLNMLASPARVFELRRVGRRRPVDRSWVCLPPPRERGVTALMTGDDHCSTLLLFETAGEWVRWVMKGFDVSPLPRVPLLELPPVPAETWMVFASFCDEFLTRYSVLQENWQPDEPIRFRADALAARLDEQDTDGDSWLSAFRSVTGETSPGPGREDLQPLLWLLSDQGLLTEEEDDQGLVHFTLSRPLTSLVGALASWDGGFWIGSPDDPQHSWLVVQASGLWVIRKQTTTEGTVMYKLDAVSGDQLSCAFADLVRSPEGSRLIIPPRAEDVAASVEDQPAEVVQPPLPPPLTPPAPVSADFPSDIPDIVVSEWVESPPAPSAEASRANDDGAAGWGSAPARPAFCTNCGQALEPHVRFCPECGQRAGLNAEQAVL